MSHPEGGGGIDPAASHQEFPTGPIPVPDLTGAPQPTYQPHPNSPFGQYGATAAPQTETPSTTGHSRKPWIIGGATVAAVAVVVAIVLATSSGRSGSADVAPGSPGGAPAVNQAATMASPDGTIQNADTFLAALDQQWKQTVADLGSDAANIPAAGKCFYVLDPASRQFTGTAMCGPIRRADSADGHVWDTLQILKLRTNATGANVPSPGKSLWQLDQSQPGLTATTRPSGTPYRPDGFTPPADADKLALPPQPVAATDLLATFDLSGQATTNTVPVDATKNTVVTPAGAFALTQVAQVATVPAGIQPILGASTSTGTQGRPAGAAPGHHLEVFSVQVKPGWPAQDQVFSDNALVSPSTPAVTVTFVNGATRTDITSQVGPTSTYSSAPSTVTFVASVADGVPIKLAFATSGHEQMMTIDTATRDADPLSAVYYKANRSVAVNATMPAFTETLPADADSSDTPVTYSATVSNVVFTPYDTAKGWAPAGQIWVEVVASDSSQGNINKVDYSKWALTAEGKSYANVAENLAGQSKGVFTFQVPATTTSVSGSFASTLTTSYTKKDYSSAAETVATKPLTFTATVS